MNFKESSVGEPTAAHEVRVGSTVQWRSIDSTSSGTKTKSASTCMSDNTSRSGTISVVFDWAFLITELCQCTVEWRVRTVVELMHFEDVNIVVILSKLKSVTLRSNLVRKNSVQS